MSYIVENFEKQNIIISNSVLTCIFAKGLISALQGASTDAVAVCPL